MLYLCRVKPLRHYLRGFLIAAWAGDKIAEFSFPEISFHFPLRPWFFFVSPAYAGKISCSAARKTERGDHPRVCGERATRIAPKNCGSGSPPRMQGKDKAEHLVQHHVGITPAHAGKRLKRSRSTVPPVAIVPLFPSVCNKPVVSNGNPAGRDAPLFLPAENAAAASAGPAESCPASRPSQFPPRIMVISPRP